MAFADRNKEEKFLSQCRDESAEHLRWASLVGAAIMIGFIWQDTLISATGYKAIIIRLFGALPVSALAWYLSGNLGARRFISYINASFWLIYACLTIALCLSYGPGPYGLTSSIGFGSVLIILFGIFTFSNLRLWASLLVGLSILLVYAASVALWTETVHGDFFMGDFLTAAALMIGMAAKTVFTERAQRRQFETSELLHQSYAAVELQVQKRTAELQDTNTILTAEVAEHRRTEEELRESETRYRTQFEDASDGMALADADTGLLVNCNEALCRMVGRKREELVGRAQSILHPPEKDAEKFSRAFRQHRTGNPGRTMEDRLVSKSGKLIPVEIRATRIPLNDRDVLMGVFRDVTERANTDMEIRRLLEQSDKDRGALLGILEDAKRSEDALREANRQLETALAEVKKSQAQIVQQARLGALGQMASGIAHDFNNLLVPLLGFSELLLNDPSILEDPKETHELLTAMHTAARDARNLVRRLREFYHPDETLETEDVSLRTLIEESLTLTEPRWKQQARAQGAVVTIQQEYDDLPTVTCNRTQMREVFTNLILNAVDAMPEGGTLAIGTQSEPGGVVVTLRDSGIGMSEDVRQHCLEPYYSTKGAKGTGMGLAMAYGVVQRHGGSIDIESAVGKGTTVRIHLPLRPPKSEKAVAAPVHVAAQRPLRVLVVDDEEWVLSLVARYLKFAGHTVEKAINGQEGVRKCAEGGFDLVITDRAMPDMSGDQVAKAVKKQFPKMPVLMLTGFGEMMKEAREHPAGIDIILGKPMTRDELLQAIEEVTEGREQ